MADENSGGSLELAKAYVQIVPSMKGVKAALAREFGDGGDSGKTFGSSFVKAALTTVSAAKVGEVIKDSFLKGADLEQSIGGVETLFKESAEKVIANAETAYKRAGVSANTYMEQATSFSASLLQSLGGDTVRAAQMADLAIVDMSDNANKFGSDITSIQNAYQGFAKQNYTMLDNLKLGYGGTKAEMERLLEDAEKLSDTELDLDISNLSDVYTAIHIVQESLDITGTTSKEAATTFSGSFASMKAASDNLLGTLTAGGNIEEAVQGLADTSVSFADNVMRMTRTMLTQLPEVGRELSVDLLEKLGASDTAAENLTTAIKDVTIVAGVLFGTIKLESMLAATSLGGVTLSVGGLTAAAINAELALRSTFAVMKANAPLLALAAVATAATVVSNKIDKMTDAIDAAYDPADHLGETFTAISNAASEAAKNVAEISGSFHGNLDDIEKEAAGYAAMSGRLKELNKVQERTASEQSEFKALVTELNKKYPELNLKIDENTGKLNSQARALDAVTEAAERQAKADEAQDRLNELWAAKEAADAAFNDAKEKRDALIAVGTDMASDAAAAINIAYLQASGALRGIKADIAEANELIAENDAARSIAEISEAAQEHEKIVEKVKNDLKDYAIEIGETTVNISQDTYDSIQGIADKYTELVKAQEETISGSLDLFSAFGEVGQTSFSELDSNLASNQQALEEWADGIKALEDAGISEGLLDELKSMGTDSLEQIRALVSATPEELQHYSDAYDYTYGEIHRIAEEQLKKTSEDSAKQIKKLISQPGKYMADLEDAYAVLARAAPDGYAKGMANEEKAVKIKMVTGDMVSKGVSEAKANLELDPYSNKSKAFERIGTSIPWGLASGMWDEDALAEVDAAANNLALVAMNRVQETLDSHSPSRVFEKIGTCIPQGMAVGIEKDSDVAYSAAAEMASGMAEAASGYKPDFRSSYDMLSRTASGGGADYIPYTSERGEQAAAKQPVEIKIVTMSGRELAKMLIDDIDELSGKKIALSGRGRR